MSSHRVDSSCSINSGGAKRYAELYNGLKSRGKDARWINISGQTDLMKVVSCIKNLKRPIFIVFHENILMYVVLASFLKGTIVMCPRGDKMKHDTRSGTARRLMKKAALCILYRCCDYFIFQSYAQRKQMVADYSIRKPSAVVYNHINASWIQRLRDSVVRSSQAEMRNVLDSSITVGFLGGDNPRKGLPVALGAIQELRRRGYEATLLIAGEFDDFNQLRNSRKYVEVHGFLKDTSKIWSRIDILWVPSRYESFPNVCLEALSIGVPFLVTDSAISREIFGNVFTSSRDPVSFARNTERVLGTESWDSSKRMKALGRKYSFDWPAMIDRKVDLLSNPTQRDMHHPES